jgi:hypothetical protein
MKLESKQVSKNSIQFIVITRLFHFSKNHDPYKYFFLLDRIASR